MKVRACLALAALLAPTLVLPLRSPSPQGQVSGFVVPGQVGANEPFTLAAANAVEGEVISVQTLEGEVVARKPADKHGRIFLATGLAMGTYHLLRGDGKGQGRLEVRPERELPNGGELAVSKPPEAFARSQGLTLEGKGMPADASLCRVEIGGKETPVLAATATEIKTGPLSEVKPGFAKVRVQDLEQNQAFQLERVLVYELRAKLGSEKVAQGSRTTLEFEFQPRDVAVFVEARILSGPVSFESGKREMRVEVNSGRAKLPLHANPTDTGPFRVAYDFAGIKPSG
jgi:hypothetical protein